MALWYIEMFTRRDGALGEFELRDFSDIEAADRDEAVKTAIQQARAEGFETAGANVVWRVPND